LIELGGMLDCLIIGAGVIGLSLAYELARHGVRVRVIDRQEPGREASWAGAGILPPANVESAVHPYDQLRGLSHCLHAQWAERLAAETGIDTGYRRCGGIHVAQTAGEAAALHAWAQELSEQQIQIEHWDRRAVAAREPALSSELRAAYWLPDEAQLRNPDHLRALIAACIQRNVSIGTHTTLRDVVLCGDRIAAIRTDAGDECADQFCFAAGAWTYQLLNRMGVETGVLPVRGQMVMFRGPPGLLHAIINEGPRYLVPRDDGRLLAGSTEEEVGFDTRTTATAVNDLSQFAMKLVPALKQYEIERTWAGLRPGSFDGFPYLGGVPGFRNAFVAAGHFRSGLHLSTGTAVLMSQLIRGEPTEIDLSPFSVARRSLAPHSHHLEEPASSLSRR
jgi:glycine oxidase